MSPSYDRRSPEGLLAALEPGGWAHSLVDYASSGSYAMDLHFRGYAGKTPHWATLYVGTTKVIDLLYRCSPSGDRFKLRAHPTYTSGPFEWASVWEQWHDTNWWVAAWDKVESYLEQVISDVKPGFLVEGVVQSAVSRFPHTDMQVVDREAVVAFGSKAEKTRVMEKGQRQLLEAVRAADDEKWWNTKPKALGGECDLLSVTAEGELIVIEVKPKGSTTTIAWSALQVAQYAWLFRSWVDQSSTQAVDVLNGMLEQRVRVGLTSGNSVTFGTSVPIRAAVAIGHGCSPTAITRLHKVDDCLAVLDLPRLEVYEAKLSGRLHPHPLW